jgi:LPXTG-site transpeptidase (sortase) family protein
VKRPSLQPFRLPLLIRVVALYVPILAPAYIGIQQLEALETQSANIVLPRPATPTGSSKPIVTASPVSVTVARLGIELAIIDGQYDRRTDSWTLSEDKAQFARMTDLPNTTAGNTFIYGHNTEQVFARLSNLEPGDTATISMSDGSFFTYVYNGNHIIQPDNTSVLKSTSKPQLTLMTCEGLLSQTRRVMFFDLKEVA